MKPKGAPGLILPGFEILAADLPILQTAKS
jgi:hypothetical protein